MDSATAASTIVATSGNTKVSVAVVKMGTESVFQLIDMTPPVAQIGASLDESQQLLTAHKTCTSKLRAKESELIQALAEADSAAAASSHNNNKNSDAVHGQMAQALGRAWQQILDQLECRTQLLQLSVEFYTALERATDTFNQFLKKPSSTTNNRKEALEQFLHVLKCSQSLMQAIRQAVLRSAPDAGAALSSVQQSERYVEQRLEALQALRHQFERAWQQQRRQNKEMSANDNSNTTRSVIDAAEEVSNKISTSLSSTQALPDVTQISENITLLNAQLVQLRNQHNSSAAQDEKRLTQATGNVEAQIALLTLITDFVQSAADGNEKLDQISSKLEDSGTAKGHEQLIEQINSITLPLKHKADYICEQTHPHPPSIVSARQNLVEKASKLLERCSLYWEELAPPASTSQTVREFHRLLHEQRQWIDAVGEKLIIDRHRDFGSTLSEAKNFLQMHEHLSELLQEMEPRLQRIDDLATEALNDESATISDDERANITDQTEQLNDKWSTLIELVRARCALAARYVEILTRIENLFQYEIPQIQRELLPTSTSALQKSWPALRHAVIDCERQVRDFSSQILNKDVKANVNVELLQQKLAQINEIIDRDLRAQVEAKLRRKSDRTDVADQIGALQLEIENFSGNTKSAGKNLFGASLRENEPILRETRSALQHLRESIGPRVDEVIKNSLQQSTSTVREEDDAGDDNDGSDRLFNIYNSTQKQLQEQEQLAETMQSLLQQEVELENLIQEMQQKNRVGASTENVVAQTKSNVKHTTQQFGSLLKTTTIDAPNEEIAKNVLGRVSAKLSELQQTLTPTTTPTPTPTLTQHQIPGDTTTTNTDSAPKNIFQQHRANIQSRTNELLHYATEADAKSAQKEFTEFSNSTLQPFLTEMRRQKSSDSAAELRQLEADIRSYTKKVEIAPEYFALLEQSEQWFRQASRLLTQMGRRVTECKAAEEANNIISELENFVKPKGREQDERLKKLSELSLQVFGGAGPTERVAPLIAKQEEIMHNFDVINGEVFAIAENLHVKSWQVARQESFKRHQQIKSPPAKHDDNSSNEQAQVPIVSLKPNANENLVPHESNPNNSTKDAHDNTAPQFLTALPSEPVSVAAGETVILRCVVEARPMPTEVSWFRDHDAIVRRDMLKYTRRTGECILTLTNASKQATQGNYFCCAANDYGSSTTETRVEVKNSNEENNNSKNIAEEEKNAAPEFLQPLQKIITAKLDELVKLEAVLKKVEPTPEVTWSREDRTLRDDRYQTIKFDPRNGVATLVLFELTDKLTGTYVCKARNKHGEAVSSCLVQVGEMDLENNSIAEEFIAPKFTRLLKDQQKISGENELLLECTVEGLPIPEISWLHDGEPVDTRKYTVSGDGAKCQLRIQGSANIGGQYVCEAVNKAGKQQTQCNVTFIPPDLLSKDDENDVILEEDEEEIDKMTEEGREKIVDNGFVLVEHPDDQQTLQQQNPDAAATTLTASDSSEWDAESPPEVATVQEMEEDEQQPKLHFKEMEKKSSSNTDGGSVGASSAEICRKTNKRF